MDPESRARVVAACQVPPALRPPLRAVATAADFAVESRERHAALCWQQTCLAAGEQVIPKCDVTNATTVCVCASPPSKKEQIKPASAATLAESANTIKVECATPNTFVPSDPLRVCGGAETKEPLNACKGESEENAKVLLSSLLSGSVASDTRWTSSDKTHTLTIPSANFPFVDKSFFVGCEQDSNFCLVSVNLSARKSVFQNRVLSCAYGKDSNTLLPGVTLDAIENSVTITCGRDGVMPSKGDVPMIFYCKDPTTNDCTSEEDLTEIIPGFTKDWWKADEDGHGGKLVVPENGFPSEPITILLGCNAKSSSGVQLATKTETQKITLPTCSVKVTLDAQVTTSSGFKSSFAGITFAALPLFFAPL
ncbi:SAG-related sequence [Besnoitia besnoiti]|uniref:SAG-related sequence n=1 Tax=Besnoitia besnoiti TaxID=94643 RepID=A0A2A9MIQ9_BESBE|nr:SAG-related sequence [Besnoitia besnoiti]PFH35272.1 SAG-related sequence [Besnoitia besnoiti]